jgi:ketosteroid isomerase-like protein
MILKENAMQRQGYLRIAGGCLVLYVLMTCAAVAQQPEPESLPSVELPADLARVLTDYEIAWGNKDADALALLFTEDGFVLSGSRPPVRGRAAIKEHYTGKGGPLSLRALAYAIEGSVGYIIGAYTQHEGQPDVGKFTLTLRRNNDGLWLIVSDMDNGNSRPKKQVAE